MALRNELPMLSYATFDSTIDFAEGTEASIKVVDGIAIMQDCHNFRTRQRHLPTPDEKEIVRKYVRMHCERASIRLDRIDF